LESFTDLINVGFEFWIDARLVFVSLFPPRNTLESLAEARRAIIASQK